ncbi:MAG TPA: HAD domain-containing protein [Baekduia sp.]|nr:HAD domain-containing protein [Baekduia sp.]
MDRHVVVVVGRKDDGQAERSTKTWLTDLSPQTSANSPNRLTQTVHAERTGLSSGLRKDWMKMSRSPQMSAKPLLFCDIDGVISLWGFGEDKRPPGTFASVDGIPHFLSTRAADHLLALAADFELVWCSGWEDKADEHLPALLGVPGGRPHLAFDGRTGAEVSARAHWKLDAVQDHAGDRPLAWIDDAFNDACHVWAAARAAPTLLVATEPATGLVDEHAAQLRAFAERASARRP